MTDVRFALGDHVVIMAIVSKDGVSAWDGFKCILMNYPRTRTLSGVQTLSDGAHGSDWATNLVALEFPATATEDVWWTGPGWIELEGDHGGVHETGWLEVDIIRSGIPAP